MEKKFADGRLHVVMGTHRYAVISEWNRVPLGHISQLAVDSAGRVWFAPDGSYRRSWGGIGSGPGQFSTPHGIWATADGRVLVGDRENNRVQIFTGDGTYVDEWGDLYHPMDIYGDADGTIFVTDQAPRVVAFSADGKVIGRCSAAKIYSHGIWGDAAGNLFLCERTGTITKLARLP